MRKMFATAINFDKMDLALTLARNRSCVQVRSIREILNRVTQFVILVMRAYYMWCVFVMYLHFVMGITSRNNPANRTLHGRRVYAPTPFHLYTMRIPNVPFVRRVVVW